MLARTSSDATPIIDDTIHRWDKAMTTTSKDELKVWGYVMTQYNLKPGLCKFGSKGQTAAVKELTQLHVMDTWTPMYADRLSREQKMRALSSLLFLKEKMLEGECPFVSSPTIKIQLECRSNKSPEGILGDLEVCSAIKPFFYYFS